MRSNPSANLIHESPSHIASCSQGFDDYWNDFVRDWQTGVLWLLLRFRQCSSWARRCRWSSDVRRCQSVGARCVPQQTPPPGPRNQRGSVWTLGIRAQQTRWLTNSRPVCAFESVQDGVVQEVVPVVTPGASLAGQIVMAKQFCRQPHRGTGAREHVAPPVVTPPPLSERCRLDSASAMRSGLRWAGSQILVHATQEVEHSCIYLLPVADSWPLQRTLLHPTPVAPQRSFRLGTGQPLQREPSMQPLSSRLPGREP